jgi:RimJ/RimL family protein N-acetyltransferase
MGLIFLDLKKQDHTILDKTIDWVRTFTPELDYETGAQFVTFLKTNLEFQYPFTVFILYDSASQNIIGTLSIIPDDQGVGKEFNLDGIWLAGVMIKRELRNKGYGTTLMKCVDRYLSKLDKPLRVNLFVCNPVALSLYEKFGFKKIGLKVIRHSKENEVCSKYYH